MPRRRPITARAAAAGLALASVLVAGGCATGSPGVVADVDGTTITEAQLKVAYDGVSEAFGEQSGPVSKRAVVDAMVRGAICDRIAADAKITITDAERDQRLTGDQSGQLLLSNPESKQIAYDLADEQILAGKLGEQPYLQRLGAAKVELNPRYGVWQNGVLAQSGSLSAPAASPSPSPAR